MFNFLSKHKSTVAFVGLCIFSLILSLLTSKSAYTAGSYEDPARHKLSVLLVPAYFLSSVISIASSRVAYLGSILVSIYRRPAEEAQIQSLKSDVESLKRQLDEEKERNKRLEGLYEVYTSLTKETGMDSLSPFSLIPARVIAVEPADWFRYLTIDKGKKDGVAADMAVITRPQSMVDPAHLTGAAVGRVVSVQYHSAKVRLITDSLSVVAVSIESLGDLVLLKGRPETEDCVIDEIPSTTYDMLKVGQAVVSDERSFVFPPGMLVGRISSIEKGINFCRVEVQPAFKFNKLKEVMVVLDTGY